MQIHRFLRLAIQVGLMLSLGGMLACGGGGSSSGPTPVPAPVNLVYSANPAVYTKGTAIPANTPTSGGGAVSSYAVLPPLPVGLALSSTSGVITGIPTTVTPMATYTVTASNGGGSAMANLVITVDDAAPGNLTYSSNPATYIAGTPIPPNTPTRNGGGAVVAYLVQPALPTGLRLDPATGVITGTPSASSAAATYTITATNSGGSTHVGLSLRVAKAITAFAVTTPDNTLVYPSNPAAPPYLKYCPDEHTTFMPNGTGGYLVFIAGNVNSTSGVAGGAVVLQTQDLVNFTFASGYASPVMTRPVPFTECNPVYDTEFDENYAAPGSVLQDPTLPPGNLLMLYEAENHCPGGVNQQPFYVTVGFARSSDNGKTWPAAVNAPLGGPARYPVLKIQAPEPNTPHNPMGNAIPSGYIDRNAVGDYYLYAVYEYYSGGISQPPYDGLLRVARAKLGSDPLVFSKWYQGAFSQPGIGGLDSTPLPGLGCASGHQIEGQISYLDDLGLYLMTYSCVSPTLGAWYYAVATSLDLQDWTAPQMIAGSQFAITSPCTGSTTGGEWDGWYPTFMSPTAANGHLKLAGKVFFMNGCLTGLRTFTSRSFTITTGP